ncbi:substrate-binding periplasmic protein [Aliidongia dinghuensis]|nr:transporter substrate-binding domain-containing protein [Aliidongia dinghuensis]
MRRHVWRLAILGLWLGLAGAPGGLSAVAAASGTAPALRFYTEEYPPITFSDNGRPAGLGTDVVTEILRRSGLEASIEVVPWARGYSYATTQALVGLFVTTRTAEREPLFKWVGPISATRGSLYVLNTAEIRPKDLQDARKLDGIAVPREWYLQQMLQGEGFANLQLTSNPVASLKLLMSGHVQAVALDDVTLEMSSRAAEVPSSGFRPVLEIAEASQFLALSRDTPDEVVERCQHALDGMKADGTFARIYHRWLPAAAPPGSLVADGTATD